jgi:tellurite resistance protein TehA-like permease
MGTGVIAVAGSLLPMKFPGLDQIVLAAWLLASLLLLLCLLIVPGHWVNNPEVLRGLVKDPVAIQFFGAPPMAIMTVGSATLLAGSNCLGADVALTIAWWLWGVGTMLGYVVAVAVPFRLFTQLKVNPDGAFGGWLMPVVPPMVSAASGALLISHVADPMWRETMLLACYAMFGMSLAASVIVITLIWSRLAHFGSSGSVRVPTLWIVLGPIGQSVTAAAGLGIAAASTLPEPYASSMKSFALMFGVPMWGFIWLWLPSGLLLTLRAQRNKMGFALTWWSFTFPVGTCVTATCQLARHTGLPLFNVVSLMLFGVVLLAWGTVLVHTAKGTLNRKLLTPPLQSPMPVATKQSLVAYCQRVSTG